MSSGSSLFIARLVALSGKHHCIDGRAVTRAVAQRLTVKSMLAHIRNRRAYPHSHKMLGDDGFIDVRSKGATMTCQARGCTRDTDCSSKLIGPFKQLTLGNGKVCRIVLPCCGRPECLADCSDVMTVSSNRIDAGL